MSYTLTTGGATSSTFATELITSVYDQVDAGFYDIKYPDILWKTVIPTESIKMDINPGAINYVIRSRDIKGIGQFINGDPNNIPRVAQVVGQVTIPILDGAVGATLTNAEARRHDMAYASALAQDFGNAMRKASEYHVERSFFFGYAPGNFLPFLDYSNATKIPLSARWDDGTPMDWVKSINDSIIAQYTATDTVHLCGLVFLPPARFGQLTEAMVVGSGTVAVATSALEYLKKNNFYTAMTGKELDIRTLRYLTGAASVGDRAIIMDWKPEHFILPFPMTYQLAQPVPVPLAVQMFAEYAFGSFNLPYSGAMAYIDGL